MASLTIIRTEKPDVIFSKGGFVSVPVCLAGAFYGAPIVIHESDSVLSLSNSLLARFAKKVCTGFVLKNPPEWLAKKLVHTGNPVRASVTLGSKDAAKRLTGFSGRRPVLLVIGGSQGALSLNKAIDEQFEHLIDRVDIIHLTGIGKSVPRIHARYYARPYVLGELPHLYALADIVVTRAGAGALSEIAAVKKPAIVIPLEGVAHDHQVRNAENLAALGAVELLRQTDIAMLGARIVGLLEEPERAASLSSSLHNAFPSDAAAKIRAIILDAVGI